MGRYEVSDNKERKGVAEMKAQRFASEYLLRRAEQKLLKQGYKIATKSEYCGMIEVTWKKLTDTDNCRSPKENSDARP
jgi:hypothetical protein